MSLAPALATALPAPLPLAAEEALQQAEAEGLTLLKSCRLASAVATAPPAPPPIAAQAALQQAEAEGLTLLKSESRTGYKGVTIRNGTTRIKPYHVQVHRGGKTVTIGQFATAEEAALCYARTPEGQAAAAAPPAPPAPPPLTAEEALRQAEAEGLTLLKSERSSAGYKGVSFSSGRNNTRPYHAQVGRDGKQVSLGDFATAEEAALVVARTPVGRATVAASAAAPPAPPPLTAQEALQQAEAEGLTLLKSESRTGYRGVTIRSDKGRSKPYNVHVYHGGKEVHLGRFATAEEAALCYARTPQAQAAAAAPPAPPAPPPLTAEEALRQAEAEGLTLLTSERSNTGFKSVSFSSGQEEGTSRSKPYQAKVRRGGKEVHLGRFATPEEAALCYARTPPAPPPLTAEEALRQAEAEGLTLLTSERSNTGFKAVSFSSGQEEGTSRSKPYQAKVRRGGKEVHLGRFATPEEAALCYARTPEAQAAAPQPSPASSRKRKVTSEELQPPDVPADVVVILEGHFVESTEYL